MMKFFAKLDNDLKHKYTKYSIELLKTDDNSALFKILHFVDKLKNNYMKKKMLTKYFKLKYFKNNCMVFRLYDNTHGYNDQPARIYASGFKYWYVNGKCHRDNDQPAIIWHDRSKEWYVNDKLHRDNYQPAVIYANGTKEWWTNDVLIRGN